MIFFNLPGWDSLEMVARMQSFFQLSGIVCIGFLMIAELGAHVYGHRKEQMQQTRPPSGSASLCDSQRTTG
jgi:hypothetical protein